MAAADRHREQDAAVASLRADQDAAAELERQLRQQLSELSAALKELQANHAELQDLVASDPHMLMEVGRSTAGTPTSMSCVAWRYAQAAQPSMMIW